MPLYSKSTAELELHSWKKENRHEELSTWKSMSFECIHWAMPTARQVTSVCTGTSVLAGFLSVLIEDVLEKLTGIILLTAHDTLC